MTDGLRIDVPGTARRDERFAPRVAGLDPGERVTVAATTTDDAGRWRSGATLAADETGVIDLAERAPVDGSYDRADPDGLRWSMTSEDGTSRRVEGWDPLGAHDLTYTATAGDRSATATVRVRHAAPGVTRHGLDDGPFGAWFEPPGDGPHPPVFVLHGSGGRVLEGTAALLASEGYAAFALRYLGAGDLPERPVGVPLSYVEDAVDWFLDRDAVDDADGYGTYGVSMGAQLGFVLASDDERAAAVVSDSGNHVCFAGGRGGAWSRDGADLPRIGIPDGPPDRWHRETDEGVVDRSDLWIGMLAAETTANRRAATLPVEESGAAVLLLSGTDDYQWPAATFHETLLARLDAVEYGPPSDHRCYAGAGHGIGVPGTPTTWRPAPDDAPIASGGDPAAHASARADAWPRAIEWFDDHLRRD